MKVFPEKIEEGDSTPAYYQLARVLHGWIMSGELRPGDRLAPELELCCRFNLSRMTVRRAIAMLVDEGLLRRERGRGGGTFVVGPKVDGGVFLIPDFQEEMRNRGLAASVRLLKASLVPAGETAAGKLGLEKGGKIIYLERVLEGEGQPLAFDRKYLVYDPSRPLLEAELGHGDTRELFSRCPELMPVRAELSLSATVLRPREADILDSRRGDPAFCMEQLVWAANDHRVAWGWMIYRGDKFVFRSISRLL
ncbi:MAG: GntR family transcriptional regulator [Actinobacteria bacterium]|nr:GntR family transcriptional regulator [Actinomycetota bacterium]